MEGTHKTSNGRGGSPFSLRPLAIALFFGTAALAIVLAGLTIPIAGTEVVTDPRELFTVLGAALTGPVGGLIIGILAGIAEPGIPLAGVFAHVAGGLWAGFAYKKLVYDRVPMPYLLLGWVGVVLTYYYVVVIPGFVLGQALFYPSAIGVDGEGLKLAAEYAALARGALAEAVFTTFLTTLVLLALPRKYRAPLW